MNLENRTILVTGASRGIGAATARAFADFPVRLALLARSMDRLQTLATELSARPGVEVLPLAADVTQPAQVTQAVQTITEAWGNVDILVNNAGVGMRSPVGEIDTDLARQLFETNYWGAIHCIEAVLPGMRSQRNGLIINISSIIGKRAMPNAAIYCGSKFALNALSESMRLELQPHNIRVTTFCPGVTATDMAEFELTGDGRRHSQNRMKRTPVQVTANAIVRAVQREPRDAYATFFDRIFALAATLTPGLMDRMLARFYRRQPD
ncbi:MAG: SDR family oxidoreductase [Caldilineales bacterium]|nr:SDR family oxidoreductase [Caldilineales bacterium]